MSRCTWEPERTRDTRSDENLLKENQKFSFSFPWEIDILVLIRLVVSRIFCLYASSLLPHCESTFWFLASICSSRIRDICKPTSIVCATTLVSHMNIICSFFNCKLFVIPRYSSYAIIWANIEIRVLSNISTARVNNVPIFTSRLRSAIYTKKKPRHSLLFICSQSLRTSEKAMGAGTENMVSYIALREKLGWNRTFFCQVTLPFSKQGPSLKQRMESDNSKNNTRPLAYTQSLSTHRFLLQPR